MASRHLPGVQRGGAKPKPRPKLKRIDTGSDLHATLSSSARSGASASSSVHSRVAVRLRPMMPKEKAHNQRIVSLGGQEVTLTNPFSGEETSFAVDFTHDSASSKSPTHADNKDVYVGVGKSMCQSILEGYDTTLLAYGMAASGKTFLMGGSPTKSGEAGLLHHFFNDLFAQFRDGNQGDTFGMEVSAFEVYNDVISDLIGNGTGLKVRDSNGAYVVDGVKRVAVKNQMHLVLMLNESLARCKRAAIKINKQSSRSHFVMELHIQMDKDGSERKSVVRLVDLAGVQKNEHTEATGERAKEQQLINRSLAAITNVIQDILARKSMVRYREHIMTKLLKGAFQKSKLFWIGCISPGDIMHDESLSVLRFLEKARAIKTAATPNVAVGSRIKAPLGLDPMPPPPAKPLARQSKVDMSEFDEDVPGNPEDTSSGTIVAPKRTVAKSTSAKTNLSIVIRPQTTPELRHNIVTARPVDRSSVIMIQPFSGEETPFPVTRAYGDETLETDVSASVGQDIVDDVLAGYNTTVVSYGLSGSGKTRALFGQKRVDNGILGSVLGQLLAEECEIDVQVFELYRDSQLTDLLELGGAQLRVGEKDGRGVQGLATMEINAPQDIQSVLQAIQVRRQTGGTELNTPSASRSTVVMYFRVADLTGQQILLTVIDLPGTQPPELTKADGAALTEQKYINKGLANLHVILQGLSSNKSALLPWRETSLVKVLKPSLTKTRLHIVATVHSGDLYYDSTITIMRNLAIWKKINLKATKSTTRAASGVRQPAKKKGTASRNLPALVTQSSSSSLSVTSSSTRTSTPKSGGSTARGVKSSTTASPLSRLSTTAGSKSGDGSSTPRRKASTWRTAVRVRPLNKAEQGSTFARDVISCKQDGVYMINPFSEQSTRYSVDRVYPTQATNEDINQDIAGDLVADALQGYDTSVLAYGLSGSGKSLTFLGNTVGGLTREVGLVEAFARQLYPALSGKNATVSLVALEIYNDAIASLHGGTTQGVKLREADGRFIIDDHLAAPARSADEAADLVAHAVANAPFAATAINKLSSRAHLIFQFWIRFPDRKNKVVVTIADLTGLQRNELTKSSGDRQKEEMAINKSLGSFSHVLQSRSKREKVIPYRSSSLTKVLQEPLRSSKMIFFACIAASDTLFDETTGVMRQLQTAKQLKGVLKNAS